MNRSFKITAIACLLACAAVWSWAWLLHQKNDRVRADGPTTTVSQAAAVSTPAERKAAELQAMREQANRERERTELEKSLAQLNGHYARWKDGVRLADSTARIALPSQVAQLQEIRRSVAAVAVSPCMEQPKQALEAGMNKVIDGFVAFMGDANLGKYLAAAAFEDGAPRFAEYERGASSCAERYKA